MKELTSQEIKQYLLSMLKEFDAYCRAHDICYSLAYGTMLGAVRHKGFIPWDDDIDIIMLRDDYDKLLECTKSDPISDHLVYECPDNSETAYPFGKIYDTNTYTENSDSPEHRGLWLDIFPLDHVCCDEKSISVIKKIRKLYRPIIIAKQYQKPSNPSVVKHIAKLIIKCGLFFIPERHFVNKIDALAKSENLRGTDVDSYINMVWGYGPREIFGYADLADRKPVEYVFEGASFYGLKDYDHYLSGLYGDYMQLPPEEDRKVHGFKAYLK